VTAGELEGEPGIDRAEGDAAGQVGVLDQPLDLGPREVRVDHEARPLADHPLVALLA
jgi:hypothetical protein